eukprot:3015807-Rhodomonas_salina.1
MSRPAKKWPLNSRGSAHSTRSSSTRARSAAHVPLTPSSRPPRALHHVPLPLGRVPFSPGLVPRSLESRPCLYDAARTVRKRAPKRCVR